MKNYMPLVIMVIWFVLTLGFLNECQRNVVPPPPRRAYIMPCDCAGTEINIGDRVGECDAPYGNGLVQSISVPSTAGGGFNIGVEWDNPALGGPLWDATGGGRAGCHLLIVVPLVRATAAAAGVAAPDAALAAPKARKKIVLHPKVALPPSAEPEAHREALEVPADAVPFPPSAGLLHGVRKRAFSPPPLGWEWKVDALMADGATQPDKAMARLFSKRVGAIDSPEVERTKIHLAPRDSMIYLPYQGSPDKLGDLRTLRNALEKSPLVALDLEHNTAATGTARPRPGKSDGKVSTLALVSIPQVITTFALPLAPFIRTSCLCDPSFGTSLHTLPGENRGSSTGALLRHTVSGLRGRRVSGSRYHRGHHPRHLRRWLPCQGRHYPAGN